MTMTKKEALQKIKELEAYINSKEPVIQKIPAKTLEWGACEEELNWEDAKKWCEEQGKGWRLPTQVELLQAYWDEVEGFDVTSDYWSASEYFYSDCAYRVNFSDGNTYDYTKTNSYSVRCVRGR